MDALELIKKRRTIRKFQQRRIRQCVLEGCLEAARLAPSAMNLQPLEYILVTEQLERIFSCTRWAGYEKEAGPKPGEEPVAYIIILMNRSVSSDAAYDVGLAAENILLSALGAGIASCVLGALDRPKLAKAMGIPATHSIELAIALGYPKQRSVVEDGKDLKYRVDSKGIVHIPKRPLQSIVHNERF